MESKKEHSFFTMYGVVPFKQHSSFKKDEGPSATRSTLHCSFGSKSSCVFVYRFVLSNPMYYSIFKKILSRLSLLICITGFLRLLFQTHLVSSFFIEQSLLSSFPSNIHIPWLTIKEGLWIGLTVNTLGVLHKESCTGNPSWVHRTWKNHFAVLKKRNAGTPNR